MDARSGQYLYWVTTSLACLIAVFAAFSYLLNADKGMLIISAVALLLAGTVWLLGRAGRHIIADR